MSTDKDAFGVQEFNIADEEDNDVRTQSTNGAGSPRDEFSAGELAVRTGTVKETRKALVGAAEAYVHMKALSLNANVAIQRCAQEQETERCRIAEEARTRRMERLADVAETLLVERHRTQREREAIRGKALREAIAVHTQMETRRIETRTGMANIFQWVLASFMGAVSATVVNQPVVRTSKKKVLIRQAGARQYVSALVLIAFVRHLWLNVSTRHLLIWADGFGPFLRGLLSNMLKKALRTILECQDARGQETTTATPPPPVSAAEDLQRFAEGKPLHGPDSAPDCWISHEGPDGRLFWHHTALGTAPWEHTDAVTTAAAKISEAGDEESTRKNSLGSAETEPWPGHFRALLANWGLSAYTRALEQNGYDAEVLKMLNTSEVEDMLQVIQCQPEDVETFQKALESWRA